MSGQLVGTPHILRPHIGEGGEWCGETMPPTMVTQDAVGEVRVDIFGPNVDLHDGYIHQPETGERFLTEESLTPDSVATYALRALSEKRTFRHGR
jgi:hypothetical protein